MHPARGLSDPSSLGLKATFDNVHDEVNLRYLAEADIIRSLPPDSRRN